MHSSGKLVLLIKQTKFSKELENKFSLRVFDSSIYLMEKTSFFSVERQSTPNFCHQEITFLTRYSYNEPNAFSVLLSLGREETSQKERESKLRQEQRTKRPERKWDKIETNW